MIAARMADPLVGASTCTSGNQVCNGHIGSFTPKAATKANSSSVCAVAPIGRFCQVWMSKLLPETVYRYAMATIMSSEPMKV